jgi:adenine-specific DNA-methyltransferase
VSKSDSLWDHPYLRTQLIAYIGNKRSLLPFLGELFRERTLLDRASGGAPAPPRSARPPAGKSVAGSSAPRFLDPFAGSGSVARLAKHLGFAVTAGDWELYSYVLNLAHLGVEPGDLPALFSGNRGLAGILSELNGLKKPAEEYIARHFAPASTENADYRRERLFYTRENALFIDAVRQRIEELYPAGPDTNRTSGSRTPAGRAKALLLASLLYQAATHANTSGVFKAYHKGFGGHGKDALERIMQGMQLQAPVLIDGAAPATVLQAEAADLAGTGSFDVAYLDPPYTGHQYGSNYFMLNTIARWDKPPVPEERGPDGRFRQKAGIRPDWRNTRSAYCYRETAPAALGSLMESIDARQIYLSYNTEGIIPFEELIAILERRGRVELFARDYTVYRGGKQSIRRATSNAELVLLVTTSELPRAADRTKMRRLRLEQSVGRLLRGRFAPERLAEIDNPAARLETENDYQIVAVDPDPSELSTEQLDSLRGALKEAQIGDHFEEVIVLARLLISGDRSPRVLREYQRRALWCLRKFSFRRYRSEFEAAAALLQEVLRVSNLDLAILREGLGEELARGRRRIAG